MLNRHCFLSFATTPPEARNLLSLPESDPCGPAAASVMFLPGEIYTILVPFTFAPTNVSATVDLVAENLSLAIASIATTRVLPVVGGSAVVEINVTVPANLVLPSFHYRLRMQGNGTALFSNRIWFTSAANGAGKSALFSFRNTRAVGLIDYTLVALNGVRNTLRLKVQTGPEDSETEKDEYEEVSTGLKTVPRIKTHAFIPVLCPRTDAFGHEGFRAMLSHRDILMNARSVTLKTGYSVTESVMGIGTGNFEVWDNAFAIVNHC